MENTTPEHYDYILKAFCAKHAPAPVWMAKPFFINDLAMATDRYSVVFFKKELAGELEPIDRENPEHVLKVIPSERNEKWNVPVSQFIEFFEKNNLSALTQCKACAGRGEVDYEFSYNSEDYTKQLECPVCEGTLTQANTDFYFDVLENCFGIAAVEKILFVCRVLNSDFFTIVHSEKHRAVIKIKEVEILVMASEKSSFTNIGITITK